MKYENSVMPAKAPRRKHPWGAGIQCWRGFSSWTPAPQGRLPSGEEGLPLNTRTQRRSIGEFSVPQSPNKLGSNGAWRFSVEISSISAAAGSSRPERLAQLETGLTVAELVHPRRNRHAPEFKAIKRFAKVMVQAARPASRSTVSGNFSTSRISSAA